jgi:prepilin-type processing-associated H-X9-DG protein
MKLGQRNAQCGFTLVDFMVIVAVTAILALMLLPRLTRSRVPAAQVYCTNSLKQICLAYRQWAFDNNDKLPTEVSVTNGGAMEAVMAGNVAAVFQVMSNELSTPTSLFCPTDRRRIRAITFSKPVPVSRANQSVYFSNNSNVSYFVGLDASNTSPSMFLSGDDNWLVGGEAGTVAQKGVPVPSGILSLWNKTPIAWSEARHERKGNIGLADGSVLGLSGRKLAEALRHTGVATNRLAMP